MKRACSGLQQESIHTSLLSVPFFLFFCNFAHDSYENIINIREKIEKIEQIEVFRDFTITFSLDKAVIFFL
jgi:hypothetical protein